MTSPVKQSFPDLGALLAHGFDELIDVRSQAEYAEDHIPGALNLPVLDNDERARVGKIYKQISPFDARKLGAALVSRNAARHLRGPLANRAGDWRPLVYCWRGGQRSGSFATILAQIGWRAGVIDGGYQRWRRLVHEALYEQTIAAPLVLLDGLTGTAKTDLLGLMAARGVQVLDLEGLAQHRGSLLGARPGGQPSQKLFETRLAVALAGLDPARPVVVEAESNKIGELHIPPALWDAMKAAPELIVEAPLAARAAYLTEAYQDMMADPQELAHRLAPLRELRGAEVYDHWQALLGAGQLQALAAALMEQHYDPAYLKSRAAHARPVLGTERSATLDPAARADLADRLVARLRRWNGLSTEI